MAADYGNSDRLGIQIESGFVTSGSHECQYPAYFCNRASIHIGAAHIFFNMACVFAWRIVGHIFERNMDPMGKIGKAFNAFS